MNPVDHVNALFNFTGTNARVTARNGKDGPVYRVSFEVDNVMGSLFMDADLTGKIYGGQLMLIDPDLGDSSQEPTLTHSTVSSQLPALSQPLKGGNHAKDAALLCNDERFQRFAANRTDRDACETEATYYLKWRCGIQSRKELDHDTDAFQRFLELHREYGAWLKGQ